MESLDESLVTGYQKHFAAAAHVLITKPNSANKRLFGAEILELKLTVGGPSKIDKDSSSSTPMEEIKSYVSLHEKKLRENICIDQCNESLPKQHPLVPDLYLQDECIIVRKCVAKTRQKGINSCDDKPLHTSQNKWETILWKRCILNKLDVLFVIFVPHCSSDNSFALVYHPEIDLAVKINVGEGCESVGKIALLVENRVLKENIHDKWIQWLQQKCFKQISKWCNAKIGGGIEQPETSGTNISSAPSPSLRLVSLEAYDNLYNQIKLKYVKPLLDANVWSTESTDPEKFIHEDIGIAVYLMLLWNESTKCPITFADVGCGNGLLVYILTQEGLGRGVGFDLRERKIWSTLRKLGAAAGQQIDLRVTTISPNQNNLDQFSEFDWVIGNHSDELTPWLPLMARKSDSSLFLLPCCPFEFYGKYQKRGRDSNGICKSTYREYLDYICKIGEKCGFKMEEDRLKIPSTKRICFVAKNENGCNNAQTPRKYQNYPSSPQIIDANIKALLDKSKSNCRTASFSARSSIEKVRNCTKVSKQNVIEPIISTVVKALLNMEDWTLESKPPILVHPLTEKRRKIELSSNELSTNIVCDSLKILSDSSTNSNPLQYNETWNAGGRISLNDLSNKISSSLLVMLKSECGGLQTLLRNHNYIFIVEDGKVRLRCPLYDDISVGKRRKKHNKDNKNDTEKFRKTKICWLYKNHPQGCPVAAENCVWAHGNEELREKI